MLGVSVWELPWDFKDGNLVCKKLVGHALSVPDREERHLLSEGLGSGEPVSRASARKKKVPPTTLVCLVSLVLNIPVLIISFPRIPFP